MSFKNSQADIIKELTSTFENIEESQVDILINELLKAKRVFFVGVGRVLLSLEAIAKRLAHIGVDTVIVGEITEPAITDEDLLIVGSGSGESLFPLMIAKKAKSYNAKVLHIGSNPNSSMKEFSDHFVRIPVQTKLGLEGEVASIQPMTSLFEQSLLLLGDSIALELVRRDGIDMKSLWKFHANLE